MKIGVDLRVFASRRQTGVGFYAWLCLDNLLALDRQNTYCLFFNSFSKRDFIKQARLSWGKYPNVEFYFLGWPNKLLNFLLFFFNCPKLDKLIGGADLFWFPNLNFWSLSKNAKSIITVHDLSFASAPDRYSPKMRLWHWLINPKKKIRQASRVIAVSQNTKNDLMDWAGLTSEKIKVIYSGVSNQAPRESQPQQSNLPEKFILYLGTLEPRKNIIGLIRAFEQLKRPEYCLVIAGSKGWLYNRIYQAASRSVLKDKIIFLDYPNETLVNRLYKQASLLVWPSFYEGFGFPPLEALSRGLPVITSANSSLPEVVGEAAIMVDPYNIKEIAQAMEMVLTDEVLRKKMIQAGYEQSKKFNWQFSVQELLKAFNELK